MKSNPSLNNADIIVKRQKLNKKIMLCFCYALLSLVLANLASADLYLNSRTGNVYLNTTNTARMQLTSGGNLVLLGLANVTFPANLTVDTNTLFVDGSINRVGIGTTGPQNPLEVIGAVTVAGGLNASSINTTGSAYFAVNSGNVGIGTTSPAVKLDVKGKANFTGNFSIGETSNIFFVDNTSGYVGIGTTGPRKYLEIAGELGFVNNKGVYFRNAADNVWLTGMVIDSNDNMYIGYDAYMNNIIFRPGNTETMRLTSGGNVGIGTTTPDNLLTVLGNELTSNAILHINASDNFNTSVKNVLTLDHTLKSPVNSTGGIGVSMLFRASDNASQTYNIGNISAILYNSTNGSQLGAITFSTTGSDTGDGSRGHLIERLRIDGNGNVGINTTRASSTFQLAGTANITSGSTQFLVNSNGDVFINLKG